MKFQRLLAITSVATVLYSTADAAVLAQYTGNNVPFGSSAPVDAHDWADHVNPSSYGGHGGAQMRTSEFQFYGWSTTFDDTRYIGFTVTPEPGYQLTLMDYVSSPTVANGNITSFKLGYRVDEGSGFGAWNFSQTWSAGDPGFAYVGAAENEKIWDFADFTTEGTVEFGLFATSPDTTSYLQGSLPNDIFLNGTVTQVPEPSAFLLSVIAGLGFIRRRR